MHEYSIVASLIDRVQQEAAAYGNARVHRLHVQIGELSGVELDLLKTAFDTFRERTICESAELEIATVSERQGRAIDRDQSGSMEKKKREGYF